MYEKSIFASKTFWGAVLTLVGALGQPFGFAFEGNELAGIADALTSLVGFALTIYGRMRADKDVKLPKVLPSFVVPLLAGLLAALLLGCASTPPPANAQETINEAKILLIATLKQTAENVRMGTMTDAERVEVVEKVDRLYDDVKLAEDLLATDNLEEAARRAQLLTRIVNELHRHVAAKARGSTLNAVNQRYAAARARIAEHRAPAPNGMRVLAARTAGRVSATCGPDDDDPGERWPIAALVPS